MRLHFFILASLLLVPAVPVREAVSNGPAPRQEMRRLELQLRLAREKKIYLLIRSGGIDIFLQGVRLKEIPVVRLEGRLGPVASSPVRSILPISSPDPVVVDADQVAIDPSADVSSLEEIVTVDAMPATFLIQLEDGTTLFVETTGLPGFVDFFRTSALGVFAVYGHFASLLRHPSCRLLHLRLSPAHARQLFWHLEPGMPLIY